MLALPPRAAQSVLSSAAINLSLLSLRVSVASLIAPVKYQHQHSCRIGLHRLQVANQLRLQEAAKELAKL